MFIIIIRIPIILYFDSFLKSFHFCRMSLIMFANGHIYEMLGMRESKLSAVTKVGAGQKGSRKHLNPNILYMMLPAGVFIFT